MRFDQKRIRYLYWITSAFIKKNLQPIMLSFLISLLGVITIVSFAPYVVNLLSTNKQVIGISGEYTYDNLPVEILSKFSNGLLHINEKGELIPLLADSWEPLDGGKEYQFHIKKDLVWNDGTPFTAKDIQYTFKDVEVIADNDYILRFKLKKPLAIFPNFLTKPIVKYPLIGVAGVYKIDRIKTPLGKISLIQLTPNQEGDPVIIYRFYETDNKLIQAYKLGEVTQMTTNRSNVADVFENWKNTEIEQLVDYSKMMTLFFNFDDPTLSEDKDVRKAIAEAIDTSKLVSYGEQATSPIPPFSWAYEPDTKKYSFNQNVASKILRKYYEASESSHLKLSTYYDNLSVADIIKEDLEDAGVQTKIEVLPGSLPQDFQLFLAQMSFSQDPDQYFFWHSTQAGNITSYKNVRVDKLLEDGRNTYALSKRKEIYSDFQKIIVDEMPGYFLYYPYTYVIKRK
ncbi:hypothetical protein CO051_05530 [Candidatus Roizmanbacteria bacterium CG_4_9_14_0_2_um_filter_39_13]|uniref:Solute-binding protein family 5 domain-containing protein n=2 Tax=Candidatus Roizmaniibacteriota TaxID=1752723 RepID=A0A2M8EX72_9BACT|nr:MAG: hypothetical protein COY15_01200 [Candidatus Roizmanbacteria bacterium CG_4_10_14_0_2_um_filter_39_12]PJC30467.1 MAG: hypothetical protein CO051_05530 [Candidatus Roizmanbacteria bacterium CG_4_9_14_0_2_um_filter_39_13]